VVAVVEAIVVVECEEGSLWEPGGASGALLASTAGGLEEDIDEEEGEGEGEETMEGSPSPSPWPSNGWLGTDADADADDGEDDDDEGEWAISRLGCW
jgi:hypothetical protein